MVKTNTQSADIILLPIKNRTRAIEVVKCVKKRVDAKLVFLFEGLRVNAAEALFEEQYGTDDSLSLARQFNITRALRVRSELHREQYKTLMNHAWLNLLNRKDQPSLPAPPEEILGLLRSYSQRNQNHYKILLEELRQRFNGLVGLDLKFHPMLPGNFYTCFWHSTERLELSLDERQLLFTLFHRFVMDRFGQVLSIANHSMAEQGFSPIPNS